ncbi:MAG: DUF4159 domain-containing protein [Myxococcaceae bacterium]|nr:DUF4159 domain-containing protein [Myxococcaceae bacterium]
MASPLALSRRATLLAALGTAASARAFGDSSKFIPAVVQHGAHWDARLSGLRRLSWELERRTSVEVSLETRPLPLTSPQLFAHPFLYWGGDGEVPPLSAEQLEALRRYLTFGGFLFVDANDGSRGSGFDASVRRELARVLPQAPLAPVPSSHVVFKSFFLLDTAPGRLLVKPELEAAKVSGRTAVLYSQNDVLGALQRDEGGSWTYEASPGGERQREYAIRLAVNVAMYALCLDYKDDAVHLPLILKKRR